MHYINYTSFQLLVNTLNHKLGFKWGCLFVIFFIGIFEKGYSQIGTNYLNDDFYIQTFPDGKEYNYGSNVGSVATNGLGPVTLAGVFWYKSVSNISTITRKTGTVNALRYRQILPYPSTVTSFSVDSYTNALGFNLGGGSGGNCGGSFGNCQTIDISSNPVLILTISNTGSSFTILPQLMDVNKIPTENITNNCLLSNGLETTIPNGLTTLTVNYTGAKACFTGGATSSNPITVDLTKIKSSYIMINPGSLSSLTGDFFIKSFKLGSVPIQPASVSNLRASTSGTSINLSWTNPPTIDSIVIFRQDGTNPRSYLTTLPANATSYLDKTVLPNSKNTYYVASKRGVLGVPTTVLGFLASTIAGNVLYCVQDDFKTTAFYPNVYWAPSLSYYVDADSLISASNCLKSEKIYSHILERKGDGSQTYTINQPYGNYQPIEVGWGKTQTGAQKVLDLSNGNAILKWSFQYLSANGVPVPRIAFRVFLQDSLGNQVNAIGSNINSGNSFMDEIGANTSLGVGDIYTATVNFSNPLAYRSNYTFDDCHRGTNVNGDKNFNPKIVTSVFFSLANSNQNVFDGYKNYSLKNAKIKFTQFSLGPQCSTVSSKSFPALRINNLTKTFGNQPFSMPITTYSSGTLTYSITSGNSFASINPSNGLVTILGAGVVSVKVKQASNGFYAADSSIATLTINKALPSLVITSTTTGIVGGSISLTASSTSSGLVIGPLWSVVSATGLFGLNGNTLTISSTGIITVLCSIAGSNNYLPYSVTQIITINKSPQNITGFNTISPKILGSPPITLSAIANSGLTVSYVSSNLTVATISGNTVTFLSAGVTTITASQIGNSNYLQAVPISQVVTVSSAFAPSQTNLSYTGFTTGTVGGVVILSATVSSGVTPSFTIISGSSLVSLSGNQLTLNQPGTVTIGISAVSTSGFTSASIQQNITIVLPTTTTLSITNLSSYTALPGQTITITGNGLSSATSIIVNNIIISNANYTINNDNSITLKLPANITGTGLSVQVVNGSGASVPANISVTNDISQVVSVSTTTSSISGGTNTITGTASASVSIPSGLSVSTVQTFYREISSRAGMQSISATSSGNNYTVNLPLSAITNVGLEYLFKFTVTSTGLTYTTDTVYTYLNYADKVPFTNIVTGNTVDKYAIISQPYTFANNTLGNVFSELGNPDSTKWRMYGFNAATSVYNEFRNISSGFQLGQGYWILTTLPVTKLNSPATVFTSTKRKPFSYKYAKGWNLIGNPYPFNIVWSDVVNANFNKNLPSYIFTYASGTYTKSAILNKYGGAFIYLQDTATIVFPVLKNPNSGGRLSDVSEISNYKDENGWNLNLEAKNSHQTFSLAGVGMRKDASKGLDRYDVPLLPSPKGFLNLQAGKNMLDVVKDTSEYVWHISTNNSGSEPIEISWDLPTDLPLYLSDRTSGIRVNMKKQSSFSLYSPQNGFDIVYGQNEVNPSEWVKLQPNPAKDYLTIRHELNQTSTLVFELLDLSGKRVYNETWLSQAGVREHLVNISAFISGIYIAKLSSSGFNHVEKINIHP